MLDVEVAFSSPGIIGMVELAAGSVGVTAPEVAVPVLTTIDDGPDELDPPTTEDGGNDDGDPDPVLVAEEGETGAELEPELNVKAVLKEFTTIGGEDEGGAPVVVVTGEEAGGTAEPGPEDGPEGLLGVGEGVPGDEATCDCCDTLGGEGEALGVVSG